MTKRGAGGKVKVNVVKTYLGVMEKGGPQVYVQTQRRGEIARRSKLRPRTDLFAHQADGRFDWGRRNKVAQPGCAQLALAILADAVGDADATALHQRFKWRRLVEMTPDSPFTLPETEVLAIVADINTAAKEAAGMRNKIATEAGPAVSEGGGAVGGDIVWDRAPAVGDQK